MNPQDQDPNTPAQAPEENTNFPSTPQPSFEAPVTPVVESAPLTPQNDTEAMQEIDTLESENSQAPQPAQPATFEAPAAPVVASAPLEPKKKSNKLVVIILVAALVIAGAVAGYFVWQSMNTADTTNTTETTDTTSTDEQTGGDLPGGNETPVDEGQINTAP